MALAKIRPQDAVGELRRAIELDPRNAEAHRSLGTLLRRTGDLRASTSEFQTAQELSEDAEKLSDAHVHRDTALQYLRRNNASAAINELRLAKVADPDAPDVDFLLAVALGMAGQQSEARRAFEAALRKKPSAPEIHFNFGVFLGRQGDFRGAAREFRLVLALRPGYPQANCLLADTLARVGDTATSRKELELARGLADCASKSGGQ